ncbi:bifunctional metallophosphatase/5'-nucleotidase [Abyssicoccus albus]|uniref:2',3'-cyclic-nucleotide 2'-phosphodiesterase (5'-nucleotidase family) n=1 Tax=Abyssicoccus albus TaxID=1817405 RepID=A0A3N5BLV3_9BACL|nr:bifunctional UDP-sugar hydrolase/5'-nucleotidase [Abyssicoccus albus]RPF57549.1 2',3'-cyclic-nucleotide 2'-phosphodiesterase (5'-nucleotidase family) [Abyssicoccus albus]
MQTIHIFHTNDIHSNLNNFLQIKEFMKSKREEYPNTSVFVDLGDHVDRSHPYTEATLGQGNIELMNEAGVDIATIGNNEGITLTHDDLNQLYDEAQFKVTCCNIHDEYGVKPNHIVDYVIHEVAGKKLLFIGVTAEFTVFYKALGWTVDQAKSQLNRIIESRRDEVDAIIVLSHLGKWIDDELSEELSSIDLILGAHTHHRFEHGKYHNGVMQAAAGKHGQYLGEVKIHFDEGRILNIEALLYTTDDMAKVEDEYYIKGRQLLKNNIISNDLNRYERRIYSTNRLLYELAEAVRIYTETDTIILNSGLIVRGFDGGDFTEYDLHKMLPHPINTVDIELKGHELIEVLKHCLKNEYKNEQVKGFGFRGDLFGMYYFHNIGYMSSSEQYFIKGERIENDQTYHIATIDMYTFGKFIPQFKSMNKVYYLPDFLRDIFRTYIQSSK